MESFQGHLSGWLTKARGSDNPDHLSWLDQKLGKFHHQLFEEILQLPSCQNWNFGDGLPW